MGAIPSMAVWRGVARVMPSTSGGAKRFNLHWFAGSVDRVSCNDMFVVATSERLYISARLTPN